MPTKCLYRILYPKSGISNKCDSIKSIFFLEFHPAHIFPKAFYYIFYQYQGFLEWAFASDMDFNQELRNHGATIVNREIPT